MKKQLLITSGRGPQECNLAVQHVVNRLEHEANRHKLKTEITSSEKDNGTICSLILSFQGSGVQEFAASWIGTIQWICASPVRKNHKRKNWFIAVLDIEEENTHMIDDKLIQFETMRSSGAGGQHVNKVSSAVRAYYPPLNIVVQVMDTRSQLQNKQIAIKRIKEKIAQLENSKNENLANQNWLNQAQIARGNPIRIFEGIKFIEKQKSRITT
ncbi:peptide chain release factor H [Sphingobacterium bovistauri]|uniref:Peptide chain release factor H n=1 Tax=Sphingobacterium bovistauri TaxID=2781959 RepID=A0ABS7Z8I5_9SPHI|nr:peptide chain release factor H [Sphingobacterium bovistauri]MCA5006470.1 peptide chain release factor H [Sphingobacterium bovistauri]